MDRARRWLLTAAHFLCPLLFFTNLTRNPYVTQIAGLNAALALALAAWAWREAERPEGARLPRLPIGAPALAFAAAWAASWAQAYVRHPAFFRPAMAAEGARVGLFVAVNALGALWLGAVAASDDDGSGGEVDLAPWIGLAAAWALLWTLFPSVRQRVGAPAEDLWALFFDPYGALLWAGGFAAAAWLVRRGRLADWLHLAFLAGFLASVYGVAQYFSIEVVWPTVLNPYGGRAVSTFGNPNFLSTYNVILMPAALALFLEQKDGGRRLAYGALFLTLEAALLATLTRSSWLGAAAGAAALALSPRVRERARAEPRALGLLLFAGAALALGWPASTISAGYTPTFLGRITEIHDMAARDGFYSPFHQRVLIWSCAWLMGSESPILGKGGGLFELFYPFYQGAMLHALPFFHTMRTHANNAHDEVLEIFSQTGLVGLGAYLWLWTSFFASARRWARERLGGDAVFAGLVAGVAGALVDNLLNVSLHFAVPAFLFWWAAGAAMGFASRGRPRVWAGSRALRRALAAAALAGALGVVWLQARFWAREAWYFAGFKLVRQNNLPAAIRALERSRSWGPREVNAIYELGNAYARGGRAGDAAAAYRAALEANAGYDEIYFNLATLENGALARPDLALGDYAVAWTINPLSSEVVNGLAGSLLRQPDANGPKLERVLSEAERDFPGNPNVWGTHGWLLLRQKRWAEAQALYERALELEPELPSGEAALAAVAAQSGRPRSPLLGELAEMRAISRAAAGGDRSPALVARAAALASRRPELFGGRFLYGSLLLATGRPAEAAAQLEWCVGRDGRRVPPRLNLGDAYRALGRLPEARAQYQAAAAVAPGDPAVASRLALPGIRP